MPVECIAQDWMEMVHSILRSSDQGLISSLDVRHLALHGACLIPA
ncbi:hypothetical protein [Parasphingorhabdus sp.]